MSIATNRFVNRDMMMCFRGGSMGHKAVWHATDYFLDDHDWLNTTQDESEHEQEIEEIEVVLEEDAMVGNFNDSLEEETPSEASMDIEENSSNGREADLEDEEQDYGYATYNKGDSDKLDDNNDDMWGDFEEEDMEIQNLDVLGPENGEGASNELEDLGFGDL